MKKKQKNRTAAGSLLHILWALMPFAVGIISYVPFYSADPAEKYPLLSAIYSSLKLYAGSAEGGIQMTLWLHIARFTGLYFSLSIILKVLDKSRRLLNRIKSGSKKNYVVCGDSVHARLLCGSIGRLHSIYAEDEFIPNAKNYVLMFSDDEQNLEYYAKHHNEMKNSRVFIRLEGIRRQSVNGENLTVFSISECCARLYWRKYYPKRSEKIAIIGFDSLGQNILTFGLQMNIISPRQHFEYHIWGSSCEFEKLHQELDKMTPDEIFFHGSDWLSDGSMLSECDRIIICSEKCGNISILDKILFSCNVSGTPIYIYSPNDNIIRSMFGNDNVHGFGRSEEVSTMDVIIDQSTLADAVKQHQYYAEKYGGKPWNRLDSFIRYSNISSADFLYVIKRLYNENHIPVEELAELEHIRWCRYYYLNNWRYGEVRCNEMRIHNCLIPYDKLSDTEKQKDIEAIQAKL